MTQPRQRLAWFGAASILCAAACAPSEPLPVLCPAPEGVGGGGAGGGGGSGLGGPDTLVVDVVTTGLDDFVAQQPAAGAVVALDLAGGRRVEQTVGVDGRVAFEGLDWSQGDSGALTAYVPGYLPHSFVGLAAESVAVLAELDGTEVLTVPLAPASEGVTHHDARPEGDKDTRATEASYLARGQAKRVAELSADIERVRAMKLRRYRPGDAIALSALIDIADDEGRPRGTLFIAPAGGGGTLVAGAVEARVLTPQAPLGRVLLGATEGDVVEVQRGSAVDEIEIVRVI